jgi:hypothetical protein
VRGGVLAGAGPPARVGGAGADGGRGGVHAGLRAALAALRPRMRLGQLDAKTRFVLACVRALRAALRARLRRGARGGGEGRAAGGGGGERGDGGARPGVCGTAAAGWRRRRVRAGVRGVAGVCGGVRAGDVGPPGPPRSRSPDGKCRPLTNDEECRPLTRRIVPAADERAKECAGRSRPTDNAHSLFSVQETRARDFWHFYREAIFTCWLSVMNEFKG